MNLDGMTEREFFAQFAKRTGMFVGIATWDRIVAWITGYESHARRHGGPSLEGFDDWLRAKPGARGSNLGWPGMVYYFAFPDDHEDQMRVDLLDEQQKTHLKSELFRMIDEFLAEREL